MHRKIGPTSVRKDIAEDRYPYDGGIVKRGQGNLYADRELENAL